ncbi:MAG: glutamate--tRNA ligase [Candidatus Bathyarchaeia archaeon]
MSGPAEEDETIRKHALLNALRHSGKASVEAVLGKILSEKPQLRAKVKEILPKVKTIVEEVNILSEEEVERLILSNWPELLQVKRERAEKALPPLPNVDRYKVVVTRFSPNPDCVLHLGSLRALILSHEYAVKYKGKFILRFEDTDPRIKKSALEFYQSIRDDLKWLGCHWDEEYVQSDRLPIYYEQAERLIKLNGGYVCTCSRKDFHEKVVKGAPCPCRDLPSQHHLERWRKMLDGFYGEGEAVLRVKTDLTHPNPAVRDWPAFRIIDPVKHPHPRVGSKYSAWPLYNFACGVDDHLMGVTHIIRGKEHLTNTLRQKYLYRHLGWKYPETVHYGRLRIVGAELSKSKIIRAVESGEVSGFDDPRMATLKALRRRGFTPECFKSLIMDVGVKPVEATVSWENIYAINRRILDPSSNRYFFVKDPIKVRVEGVPSSVEAVIPYHPDHPSKGSRKIALKPVKGELTLYISSQDLGLLKPGQILRLMELMNVEVIETGGTEVKLRFHSKGVEEAKALKAPIIQWVDLSASIKTSVVMPDASISNGLSEGSLRDEKIGSTVQLVRFGFARVEEKLKDSITLYFTHP